MHLIVFHVIQDDNKMKQVDLQENTNTTQAWLRNKISHDLEMPAVLGNKHSSSLSWGVCCLTTLQFEQLLKPAIINEIWGKGILAYNLPQNVSSACTAFNHHHPTQQARGEVKTLCATTGGN